MSKTFIDKACAVVPEFENRISRFDKKLRMAQYVEHIFYDNKIIMAQIVAYSRFCAESAALPHIVRGID